MEIIKQIRAVALHPLFSNGVLFTDIPPTYIKVIQQGLRDSGRPILVDGIAGHETVGTWISFKQENHQAYPDLVGKGSLELLARVIEEKPVVKKDSYYELTPIRSLYLDLIAYCEGTDRNINGMREGYNIRYAFKTFSDYSKFPTGRITANGITSSASGRYQIMDFTWYGDIQPALNLPDFSPDSQDQACLWLLHIKRKILHYVDRDNLKAFCSIASWEWASIPPSRYGQGNYKYNDIVNIYNKLKKIWKQ
jgi:muramidase (phage lysozyme)